MKFKIKNYQKYPRVNPVSKTRSKFSNSKIAYKNNKHKFFVFFSKKYVKQQKFQKKKNFEFRLFFKKFLAKNRNSITFEPVIKKISKSTWNNFLMGTKKCQKMKEIKN